MEPITETVPKRIRSIVQKNPDTPVLYSKDGEGNYRPLSYHEFFENARIFGTGLHSIGIQRGDHVGIICDNRQEWLIADTALLGIGALNVPRGSDSMPDEVAYILHHADCKVSFAEDAVQLEKILSKRKDIPQLKTIIVIDKDFRKTGQYGDVSVLTYDEVFAAGEAECKKHPDFFETELEKGSPDDLATIIYTSGTTGNPKGVMLTHRSFIFQMDRIKQILFLGPGDIFLTVLPIWHSFERAVEYIVMNNAAAIAYSKPVGKIMLEDIQKIRPTWMTSVPRIWENVRLAIFRKMKKEGGLKKTLFFFFAAVGEAHAYFSNVLRGRYPQFKKRSVFADVMKSIFPLIALYPFKGLGSLLVFRKIKKTLGGRFVAGVSGGGALPPYVDRFFQAAGILLLEGYGLTETGPILSVRLQKNPVAGTVGPLLPDIEFRLLGEDGRELPPGEKGVLYVKSEQVMVGYYKRPDETEKVLKDGWLNTGDIALYTYPREFKILGRAKETIVLMGGENVEPVPIEEKLAQSPYIEQAMVVGQDKKFLGALIIPNYENLTDYADGKGLAFREKEDLIAKPEILELIQNEIQSLINQKNGFKAFERIFRFTLLPKPFEVGKEITQSLKIKRNIVNELYKDKIESLFK